MTTNGQTASRRQQRGKPSIGDVTPPETAETTVAIAPQAPRRRRPRTAAAAENATASTIAGSSEGAPAQAAPQRSRRRAATAADAATSEASTLVPAEPGSYDAAAAGRVAEDGGTATTPARDRSGSQARTDNGGAHGSQVEAFGDRPPATAASESVATPADPVVAEAETGRTVSQQASLTAQAPATQTDEPPALAPVMLEPEAEAQLPSPAVPAVPDLAVPSAAEQPATAVSSSPQHATAAHATETRRQPVATGSQLEPERALAYDPADETGWSVLPATAEELAAVSGATASGLASEGDALAYAAMGAEFDEILATGTADEAGPRRRRRRGRGRRGGANRAPTPDTAGGAATVLPPPALPPATPVAAAPAAPLLPAYPVEFEPLPPPTKRRPARRPGDLHQPRFSATELQEIERFVGGASAVEPALEATELSAKPLTPDEERLLQVAPRKRSRRGRGRGPAAETLDGEEASGEAEPSSIAHLPTRDGSSPLEALIARQNIILDTMLERQTVLLRSLERSVAALDRRLAAGGNSATNARVGVFVDVPNVIYAADRINCTIDFGKLLTMLTRGRELVRATAYAPVSDDPQARLDQQKFVQPFVGRGYRIMTKPLKRFADGTMKGNFDVEMAMDVLTMADRLDVVSLVSGDGDFRRLVEMVASKGVRIEVIAFSASMSSELRAAGDEYIDLGLRLQEICGG